MDSCLDEDDPEALSGLIPVTPPQKTQKPAVGEMSHHQTRNHSLDDLPRNSESLVFDASDDELCPYPSSSDMEDSMDDYVIVTSPQVHANIGEKKFKPLAEFIAAGGNADVFKVPSRAVVHPGRPPCVEIRPHPVRETQSQRFLRNIVCTGKQLWAGLENGVRFWELENVYEVGCRVTGKVRVGDEDTAPFHESLKTPPTTCLMVDYGTRLVWSGHEDGKIRSWKMNKPADDSNPLKHGLSWQAHRGPVNSIVMSCYGDMWSCSEGGIIKMWTWESIEKYLSCKSEEKYMATQLLETSGVDLRSHATINGICSISSSDVKCLFVDKARAKVWAVQPQTFSLWDARTKDLLKVLNFDGQMENRVEIPSLRDHEVEDEMSARFICTSRKEKSQGFMQRSSNAIVGAADAVRRAATRIKGACIEDTRRTESIVLGGDGTIWSGCLNGLLVQWDGNGNRLREMKHHNAAVLCFCSSGDRIYVGYSSGYIQVLNLEGNLVASWVSHSSPVIKLAAGNDFVFSLAAHGGIRAWHVTSPGPMDDIIRSELSWKEPIYSRQNNIRILIGTWNVGEGRATYNSLKSWLGSVATNVGIVVVGLQEVDMGAGFLAVSAAKEIVGLEGSAAGNWWLDAIGKALDDKSSFEQIGSRQLGGLVISLWVRKNLRSHVGDIDVAAVPCGFARAFGNKGGVGLRIRVFDRTMCFVNCHLAAHLEAVNHRNADFDHIYRTMVFTKPSTLLGAMAGMVPRLIVACTLGFFIYLFWLLCSSGFPWALSLAAGVSIAVQMLKAMNNSNNFEYAKRKPDLAEADLVTFFGDLNYRLSGITYDEARDFISHRCFDGLKEKDQLRLEMKAGRVFQGMREPVIAFPPTYKFERHRPGLAGYDSGGQKRIPAWCDRVIYRDNQSSALTECSLACPVVASVLMYEACMDVTESDHKPVCCKLDVNIAHVDRSARRQELGKIIRSNDQIRSMLNGLCNVPETTVSINSIVLQSHDTARLEITNQSANDTAVFKIVCEGQSCVKDDVEAFDYIPRGCFGFPQWFQVTPAAGIIKPGSSVEVSVHHEDIRAPEEIVDGIPRSWWCEDTRDKEALLAVTVEGSCSTERVSHRIKVRYCFSELDGLKKHVGGSRHHRF